MDEGSYAHKLEHETVNENEIFISAKIEEELVELSDEEKSVLSDEFAHVAELIDQE